MEPPAAPAARAVISSGRGGKCLAVWGCHPSSWRALRESRPLSASPYRQSAPRIGHCRSLATSPPRYRDTWEKREIISSGSGEGGGCGHATLPPAARAEGRAGSRGESCRGSAPGRCPQPWGCPPAPAPREQAQGAARLFLQTPTRGRPSLGGRAVSKQRFRRALKGKNTPSVICREGAREQLAGRPRDGGLRDGCDERAVGKENVQAAALPALRGLQLSLGPLPGSTARYLPASAPSVLYYDPKAARLAPAREAALTAPARGPPAPLAAGVFAERWQRADHREQARLGGSSAERQEDAAIPGLFQPRKPAGRAAGSLALLINSAAWWPSGTRTALAQGGDALQKLGSGLHRKTARAVQRAASGKSSLLPGRPSCSAAMARTAATCSSAAPGPAAHVPAPLSPGAAAPRGGLPGVGAPSQRRGSCGRAETPPHSLCKRHFLPGTRVPLDCLLLANAKRAGRSNTSGANSVRLFKHKKQTFCQWNAEGEESKGMDACVCALEDDAERRDQPARSFSRSPARAQRVAASGHCHPQASRPRSRCRCGSGV